MRFTLTATLVLLTNYCFAAELLPADYSPTERASIKTLRVDRDGNDFYAVVAVANLSDKPFDANYACTIFNRAGAASDETHGPVSAVPPGQEVVAKSLPFTTEPSKVVCRIELTVPTHN